MEKIPNGFYRMSIKALILNEEKKFLLFQEDNGTWDLPGGGLDFEETPGTCIRRELFEEAGLVVLSINSQPSYFVTGRYTETQWKGVIVYETQVKDLTITPSDECAAVRFFSKEEALEEKLYDSVIAFVNEYNPIYHTKHHE